MKRKILLLLSLLMIVSLFASCTPSAETYELVWTYFVVKNESEHLIVAEIDSPTTIFMVPYEKQSLKNANGSTVVFEDFSAGQMVELTLSGKYLPEAYPDMIRDCSQIKLLDTSATTEQLQLATETYMERSGQLEEVSEIKIPDEVPSIFAASSIPAQL